MTSKILSQNMYDVKHLLTDIKCSFGPYIKISIFFLGVLNGASLCIFILGVLCMFSWGGKGGGMTDRHIFFLLTCLIGQRIYFIRPKFRINE